jgi:hypothetical protein
VLQPGGTLVIGFIDRASARGRYHEAHRQENVFHRGATSDSADEVEPLRAGRGAGSFLVVLANRP